MDTPIYHGTHREIRQLKEVAELLSEQGKHKSARSLLRVARRLMRKTILGSLPSNNILSNISNLCNANSLSFAVIGGLAVNVHGQARGTEDVDILVSDFPEPWRLQDSAYMRGFGFYKTKSSTGTVLTLDTIEGMGYAEMLKVNSPLMHFALSTAQERSILGATVPVVDPVGLIGLKILAMTANPKRAVKDKPDIMSVLVKNEPDLSPLQPYLTPQQWAVLMQLEGAAY